MKKIFTIFCLLILGLSISAQNTYPQQIKGISNHTRTHTLNRVGFLYNNFYDLDPFMDYNGETLFKTGLSRTVWISSLDETGEPLVSASTYGNTGTDYKPGPIIHESTLSDSIISSAYNRIWKVSKVELETVKNLFDLGYLSKENLTIDILEWPAIGNPHLGEFAPTESLAPYYDSNQDGIYNPLDGDYPITLEENPEFIPYEMMFSVFNDDTEHNESGSEGIKMEFHQMNYVTNCGSASESNNAIYTRLKYNYKGNRPAPKFRLGIWEDNDLGCPSNDFSGFDKDLNCTYTYNKDLIDSHEDCSDELITVPQNIGTVKSLVFFNTPAHSSLNNSTLVGDIACVNPDASSFLLEGLWPNGSPVTVGGTGYNPQSADTTLFAFPDRPNDPSGWSMQSEQFQFYDHRTITTLVKSDSILPGSTGIIDFADHVYIKEGQISFSLFDEWAESIENLKEEHLTFKDWLYCEEIYAPCYSDCVWPGDVDDDGCVTARDYVQLGSYINTEAIGPQRKIRSSQWRGYDSSDWSSQLFDQNAKYADVSGDGSLNLYDLDRLKDNIGLSRVLRKPNLPTHNDAAICLESKLKFINTIDAQELGFFRRMVELNFRLSGDLENVALHGISFDIHIDTSRFVILDKPSALTEANESFSHHLLTDNFGASIARNEYLIEGPLSVAFTNTNGTAGNNLEDLGDLEFLIRTGITTSNPNGLDTVIFELRNIFATDTNGNKLEICAQHDSLIIVNIPVDSLTTMESSPKYPNVLLYPNPSSERLNLIFDKYYTGQLTIYNMTGVEVMKHSYTNKAFLELYLSNLNQGQYLIEISQDGNEPYLEKFIKY